MYRPPTYSEVQVLQAKVAGSSRLEQGHFGQTNNHDWPQNYAANPELTLPMAPGIAGHLQTAANLKVSNPERLS